MSILLWRPSEGTATPTPGVEPTFPPVPLLQTRIAWRGGALTMVDYDGSDTTGWVTAGTAVSGPASSITSTESDSFGGGSSLEVVTGGTAASGVDFPVGGTAVSGRTYRYRVGLKSISGSTSTALRVGNASDFAASTATITTGWAWYTLDWTPGTAVTDAWVSVQNGAAATQTTRLDHPEVYEALDEVAIDALRVQRGSRYDGGAEAPGTFDLSLLDPDGTYTPRNSASSLADVIGPGPKVHIRATYGGRLYPVAYGVIRNVAFDPFSKRLTIDGEDGLFELDQFETARAFSTDTVYHEVRQAVLTAEALTAAELDLTTDSLESDTFSDGTDSTMSLLAYLESLNETTGTLHYCAPHVEAIRPWRYTTISRASLTNDDSGAVMDDDFQRVEDVYLRDEAQVKSQRVTWTGYERRPSQVVVQATSTATWQDAYWTYTDERYGTTLAPYGDQPPPLTDPGRAQTSWAEAAVPFTVPDGETKTVHIEFLVPMQDISADVTSSPGTAITTTSVSEPYRHTVFITAAGADETVSDITITASPRIPDAQQDVTIGSSASTLRQDVIDSSHIVSGGQARGVAEYVAWRYGAARYRPVVTDQHQPVRQLTHDIGAHLTLSADRWLIDADRYVVRTIEHDVRGLEWETTFGLEELPDSTGWVTLDSDRGLDHASAVLAY